MRTHQVCSYVEVCYVAEPNLVLCSVCSVLALVSCTRKESVEKPAPEKAAVKLAWDKVIRYPGRRRRCK